MRRIRPILALTLATLTTGCYALQPVNSAAVPAQTQVAFDVSDVGRLALGGPMGPSLARVEGRLVRHDSAGYRIAVSSVTYVGGGTQVWSGEPVTIRSEDIAVAYARRFSKSRTLAASAVGIGAVAFLVTRSIIGSGDSDSKTPPPSDSAAASRGRRH